MYWLKMTKDPDSFTAPNTGKTFGCENILKHNNVTIYCLKTLVRDYFKPKLIINSKTKGVFLLNDPEMLSKNLKLKNIGTIDTDSFEITLNVLIKGFFMSLFYSFFKSIATTKQ